MFTFPTAPYSQKLLGITKPVELCVTARINKKLYIVINNNCSGDEGLQYNPRNKSEDSDSVTQETVADVYTV